MKLAENIRLAFWLFVSSRSEMLRFVIHVVMILLIRTIHLNPCTVVTVGSDGILGGWFGSEEERWGVNDAFEPCFHYFQIFCRLHSIYKSSLYGLKRSIKIIKTICRDFKLQILSINFETLFPIILLKHFKLYFSVILYYKRYNQWIKFSLE